MRYWAQTGYAVLRKTSEKYLSGGSMLTVFDQLDLEVQAGERLARALATAAALSLADEPPGNLDAKTETA